MNPQNFRDCKTFKPLTREWRIYPDDIPYINAEHPRAYWFGTTDDEFTQDSRATIEYYSTHYPLNTDLPDDEYLPHAQEFAQVIKDNDTEFQEPEHWLVRQLNKLDRPIMGRFIDVPLPYFWKLWRRPLIAQNIEIDTHGDIITVLGKPANPEVWFRYHEEGDPLMTMSFTCYLEWNKLYYDMFENPMYEEQKIMPWLHKNMQGGLYLFSDFDSLFEDAEDEVTYLADFEI